MTTYWSQAQVMIWTQFPDVFSCGTPMRFTYGLDVTIFSASHAQLHMYVFLYCWDRNNRARTSAYLEVVRHPGDVSDWEFMAVFNARHGAVANDRRIQCVLVFKARLSTNTIIMISYFHHHFSLHTSTEEMFRYRTKQIHAHQTDFF